MKQFGVLNINRFNRVLELVCLETGIIFIYKYDYSVYEIKIGQKIHLTRNDMVERIAS